LETGERRWHNRAFEASYASPIVVDGPAGRQLVAAVAGEVVGLDPRDGTLLWRREHANRHRTFLSSPVAGGAASGADGEVVFASAYFLGSLALRLGDGGSIETLWEREDLQVSQSNALRFDSTIVASHNRQLVAVDLLTGTQRWREKGVGRVNLVHAGERTLLLDDRGRLSLARIDADGFERLATTRILDGRTWTAPTLVGDRLYVRDLDRVVAIDLSAAARYVGETFAGRLEGGGDRPPVVAPATFLDAAAPCTVATARGDRQVLVSAATAFDRWQDDGELASFALYYQGFTAWRLSGLVEPDRQLAQVDRAVELLKRAVDIDPALADAHALLSDLYGKYYRLAPQRASVVGPIGDEHLDRALDLDPENPRVVALHGLDLIRSPARYGGDPVRGMRQLGDAITALDGRSRRASDPAPSWGASIFRVWFAQALSRAGDQERAAAVLEAALRIVPENAAARTLLDSLNRAEAGADPEHGSR
ncbi:MAG: PQQ-binding-like beta-propeller repeat protein, partial [Acidobacteriota bacterium]